MHAGSYDAAGECNSKTDQVPPKLGKNEKFISTRDAHQKHGHLSMKNQLEYLINDKLARNGEPDKLFLHLASEGYWQKK